MRFLHLADLHLGKVIYGTSLLENGDQPYWVDAFLHLSEEVRPDAVVIAGDVYDRSSPSGEAVALLSRLVEGLSERSIPVMLVSGNHDSGKRMAFARDILARQNVHIAGDLTRELEHVTLTDKFGPITFWLMPYVFPTMVSQLLDDESIRDYDTAVRRLLTEQPLDPATRNVIVAHQNVTCGGVEAQRGGSESMVGGVGQIDFTAFDLFDYAALGHIHAAYHVGRETVRYAGSPLCYHFDETRQPRKGPVLVELNEKGAPVKLETLHIPPLHPMREIRGPLEEIKATESSRSDRNEYLRLIVTDQPMTPEISDFFQALAEKRDSVLMERLSELQRFSGDVISPDTQALREKSLEELFADFFSQRSGGEALPRADQELLAAAGELIRNNQPDPRQRYAVDPGLTDALLRILLNQEVSGK